jgi:hypothetical protein
VLTGIVVAEEREAAAVAREAMPRSSWAGIDLRGIEVVKLASLWSLLASREFHLETIEEFLPLHEESDDGPWVYRFPADLAQLLAELDEDAVEPIAGAWAATDELALDGWDPSSTGALLRDLRAIVRAARERRKPLLLWMTL